jgi:hypothetical protein
MELPLNLTSSILHFIHTYNIFKEAVEANNDSSAAIPTVCSMTGRQSFVHRENVTLSVLVGLSLFPLEYPQVLGWSLAESRIGVLLATRKYHSH